MILSFADFIGGFGSLCCCTYHCSNSIGSLAKCIHLLFKVVSYTTRLSGVAIILKFACEAELLGFHDNILFFVSRDCDGGLVSFLKSKKFVDIGVITKTYSGCE